MVSTHAWHFSIIISILIFRNASAFPVRLDMDDGTDGQAFSRAAGHTTANFAAEQTRIASRLKEIQESLKFHRSGGVTISERVQGMLGLTSKSTLGQASPATASSRSRKPSFVTCLAVHCVIFLHSGELLWEIWRLLRSAVFTKGFFKRNPSKV